MQKSNKFIVGMAALAVVIGIGMYLSRRHKPIANPALDKPVVTAEVTNRPPVHVQRPAPVEKNPEAEAASSAATRREKVEEYLRRHNRDAASLLAAFHSEPSGEMSYLYEAATNFPNDPRVQWTVLARNVFPEERRKWLDDFKASSPSNSVADYLSAQDHFKNNQSDAAIKELLAASGKSQFKDYSMDTILDAESLGQFEGSSGLTTHIAAMSAMAGDNMPVLANFKGVATGIRDVQQQYANSGDLASVQTLAQAGVGMADHLMTGDSGKFIINQLVGMASETIVLQALDQNTAYSFLGGQTPAERLADLKQQKETIREFSKNQNAVLSLDEEGMASYWERVKVYGEMEAMRWLNQQNAAMPNSGN